MRSIFTAAAMVLAGAAQAAAPATVRAPAAAPGTAAEAPAAAPTDVVGRLATLADLHARGALTDEEFVSAKARVLAGE